MGAAQEWPDAPQAVSALEKAFQDALAVMPLEQVLLRVMAMFPPSRIEIDTAGWHLSGPFKKVSVSMPEGLIDAVRERTGPGEFSRYVTEAVEEQLQQDRLDELAAWLVETYGTPPAEHMEWAERVWQGFDKA